MFLIREESIKIREESIQAMGGELNDLTLDGLSIDLHGQSLANVL